MDKIRLGIIYGSRTCEHDVSVITACQLMRYVKQDRYDVIPIYITRGGEWYSGDALKDVKNYADFQPQKYGCVRVRLDMTPGSGTLTYLEKGKGLFAKDTETVYKHLDCVIPVFHGLHGEDGTVQGLLELCNLPYTSCGVGASAIGMDKVYMKQFFRGAGFPVLPDTWALRREWESDREAVIAKVESVLPYPVFVKPACLGSSIGVSRADDREGLIDALELAFDFDRKVLIEQGLDHPIELNCSVLGYDGECTASEIEMPLNDGDDMLTFVDKYMGGSGSKGMASLGRVLPAKIEPELKEKLQRLACDIFNNMDCKGVVRIDFMYDAPSEKVYITEINTIPGSMAFYLWQASGLGYSDMIDRIVDYAMKAQSNKDDSNYAFHSDILGQVDLGGVKGSKGTKFGPARK